MKKQAKFLLTVCSAIFGLSLVVTPFLMAVDAQEAEKSQKTVQTEVRNQPVKNDVQMQQQERQAEREKARQEVAKSAVGSVFFDQVSAKDSEWVLGRARYLIKHIDENPVSIQMSYQKDDKIVHVDIMEFDTIERAVETFNTPRSYGASVKFDKFGDWGETIYGDYGFIQINFRKGNFRVTIAALNKKTGKRDEQTSERFAGYVEESLARFALGK
jgi:hypothetical protein